MEFDIGTILYIVITLVAVLAGVLGKKKKPARTPAGEDTGSRQEVSFLESFERAFNMEQGERTVAYPDRDEYGEPEPEITEEPLYMESTHAPYEGVAGPDTRSILDDYDRIMGKTADGEPDFFQEGQASTETIEIVELEDEGTDYFEIVKDFDAGTAVVYSAIINRVEY